jgi:hypothetical protein
MSAPLVTLLRQQMRDTQAVRDRPTRLRGESRAQLLPLLRILREPRLFLGMRRKIGFDVLGALARQLTVDAGVQVVLFYGPTQRTHLTLLSSALWRRRCPLGLRTGLYLCLDPRRHRITVARYLRPCCTSVYSARRSHRRSRRNAFEIFTE